MEISILPPAHKQLLDLPTGFLLTAEFDFRTKNVSRLFRDEKVGGLNSRARVRFPKRILPANDFDLQKGEKFNWTKFTLWQNKTKIHLTSSLTCWEFYSLDARLRKSNSSFFHLPLFRIHLIEIKIGYGFSVLWTLRRVAVSLVSVGDLFASKRQRLAPHCKPKKTFDCCKFEAASSSSSSSTRVKTKPRKTSKHLLLKQ